MCLLTEGLFSDSQAEGRGTSGIPPHLERAELHSAESEMRTVNGTQNQRALERNLPGEEQWPLVEGHQHLQTITKMGREQYPDLTLLPPSDLLRLPIGKSSLRNPEFKKTI